MLNEVKCHICGENAVSGYADNTCDRCWELKTRIDSDPDLALDLARKAIDDRNDRSPLGKDLRDEIIGYVGKVQATECAEDGEEILAWVDVLVDGVRGLTQFSDKELLEELAGCRFDGKLIDFDPELEARLNANETWLKITKELDNPDGELADEVGLDGDLAEGRGRDSGHQGDLS